MVQYKIKTKKLNNIKKEGELLRKLFLEKIGLFNNNF